jgi:hypothetical protein
MCRQGRRSAACDAQAARVHCAAWHAARVSACARAAGPGPAVLTTVSNSSAIRFIFCMHTMFAPHPFTYWRGSHDSSREQLAVRGTSRGAQLRASSGDTATRRRNLGDDAPLRERERRLSGVDAGLGQLVPAPRQTTVTTGTPSCCESGRCGAGPAPAGAAAHPAAQRTGGAAGQEQSTWRRRRG